MDIIARCPYSFCHTCGTPYIDANVWPRKCDICLTIVYRNPIPGGLGIIPVKPEGIVVVRRALQPNRGGLVLPGGYIHYGESAEEAIVREINEETGLVFNSSDVKSFGYDSTPSKAHIMLCGILPFVTEKDVLKVFSPTREVSAVKIWRLGNEDLAVKQHHDAVMTYLESEMGQDV